jgi:hypothetical protein
LGRHVPALAVQASVVFGFMPVATTKDGVALAYRSL